MQGHQSQCGRHVYCVCWYEVVSARVCFRFPFNSFDATYSFYPTENLILKVKRMNLLDEAITIERDGVLVFEEKPGMAISASAKYDF